MGKSKFTALLFLVSGVLMSVCCFLPIKTITMESAFESSTDYVKFMPSFGGIFIFALALGCVICPIVGFKKQSALVGTGTALLGGAMLIINSANAGRAGAAVAQVNEIMGAAFGSSAETSITVTTNFGFYLMILALVLVLITGFAYTLSEDY